LVRLRQEHRDLDVAFAALEASGRGDPIRRQRLKKRKLQLKDRIVRLEDRLLPDIIA
ncbi:MAG: YdcH family protein, partial [Bauldia sp.]